MDVKLLLLVYFHQAFWRFKHKNSLPPTDLLAREDHHQQSPGQGHQIGALGTLLFEEFRFRQDNEKTDGGYKEQYRRDAFDDVVFIRTTAQSFHVQIHPYDETGEESEAQNRRRNDVLRKHTRHFPDKLQVRGNRTSIPPPRELHSLGSHLMA